MNGSISAEDAQLALEFVVNGVTFSDLQKYLADVNGDGEIEATDANLVLQIVTRAIE